VLEELQTDFYNKKAVGLQLHDNCFSISEQKITEQVSIIKKT